MDYNCLGYRFRPTEDEIITYFLQNKIHGHASRVRAINTLNICAFEPWELPEQAATRDDEEWYFFSELQKKYANSDRVDRTTKLGSWKVTGGDRQIWDNCGKEVIGVKKNLVFHKGHGSKAKKTSWVIHEYHSSKASVHQMINPRTIAGVNQVAMQVSEYSCMMSASNRPLLRNKGWITVDALR